MIAKIKHLFDVTVAVINLTSAIMYLFAILFIALANVDMFPSWLSIPAALCTAIAVNNSTTYWHKIQENSNTSLIHAKAKSAVNYLTLLQRMISGLKVRIEKGDAQNDEITSRMEEHIQQVIIAIDEWKEILPETSLSESEEDQKRYGEEIAYPEADPLETEAEINKQKDIIKVRRETGMVRP